MRPAGPLGTAEGQRAALALWPCLSPKCQISLRHSGPSAGTSAARWLCWVTLGDNTPTLCFSFSTCRCRGVTAP